MIKTHVLEVTRNMIKCKDIGKYPSYPSLGPHMSKDLLIMCPLMDVLMRSLDLRRMSAFAQFDTFRRSLSDFSTVWKAFIKLFI